MMVTRWMMCLCATQQTRIMTLIEAVSPTRLPAAARLAAGLWHLISIGCQLKANMPTCPPLYVAPLQILSGLFYCLLAKPKATGHLHPRGGAGSVSEDSRAVAWCEPAFAVCGAEERGKRADQRAALSICQFIDEEQRRGGVGGKGGDGE